MNLLRQYKLFKLGIPVEENLLFFFKEFEAEYLNLRPFKYSNGLFFLNTKGEYMISYFDGLIFLKRPRKRNCIVFYKPYFQEFLTSTISETYGIYTFFDIHRETRRHNLFNIKYAYFESLKTN